MRPGEVPQLVGRHRELRVLSDLLDGAAGRGAAMVVTGDPGIGKSALLQAVQRMAGERGWRVLTAAGVQSEAQLPYAGLHQLLRPVESTVRDLPPLRRDALLSAFGRLDGTPPEPYLIALAAANLVALLATTRPVVVLSDDVHWLDPQTQQALALMARRVAGNAVAVIGAVRSGYPGPFVDGGFAELELRGVDEAAAERILLAHAADLSVADRARIRREARGNPLALLELPPAYRIGDATAAAERPPSLPARLEFAFAARIRELPARTRDAVLVAAVDPVGDVAEILAATSALRGERVGVEVLEAAARVRLVVVDGGTMQFRHPLVRSGVLGSETATRRQAANAALAAVLVDEPYRRTWHRAQSIIGPDNHVADELEANIAVALRRGGVMSAVADLERAAQLTSGSAGRGRRLLLAATHAFGLGRADMVDRLVRAAARTDLSGLDRARMEWLREIFHDGVPGDAARVLQLCAVAEESAGAADADLALNLLLGAALRCWWADTGPGARARVVATAGRLTGVGEDPRQVAALAVADPIRQCRPVADLLSRVAVEDLADADALRLLGMAAHAIGDEARAADLLDRAEVILREQGRFGLLPHVLSMQVQIRIELGDWDGAAAAAGEGQHLAEETGQPIWSTGTLACDARATGLRGDIARALRLAGRAENAARRHRLNDLLACVQLARGAAWLSAGRHAEAYAALRRLFDPSDPSFHQRERFAGLADLAEAAVRAGRREDARTVVADLERVAAGTPSPILRIHLSYARAILAGDEDAEELYLSALGQDLTRWPWMRARVELAYGAWLCRQRRPEARTPLRSALAVLDAIGARAWADEARRLLAAVS
jgi:tetratricopeptide (TPR) repeat protein